MPEVAGRPTKDAVTLMCCILAGTLAAGIALHGLLSPHGLYGVTQYDDGVYLGAALRLVSGALPYKDFTLVQPPGIAVILAPVALLSHLVGTRGAMALARLLTVLVAGANAFLAAWLLRRLGVLACAVGGLALAIFPPAFYADHSVLLEPYTIALSLLGANLVFSRGELASSSRIMLGGIALGLAGSVKLWAIVPAAVLALCLLRRPGRELRGYLLGVTAGFLVVCLPFFALAPGSFVHDVFVTQLARQTTSPRQPGVRLWGIVGLHGLSLHFARRGHTVVAVVLAAVIGALLLAGGLLPALRARARRVELFALLSALGAVALLFIPVEYFDHYTYFSAAFLAVALGCAAGRGAAFASRHIEPGGLRRHLAFVLVVLLLAVLGAGSVRIVSDELAFDRSALHQDPLNWPEIAAVIPAGACVTTDAATLTIEADRFLSTRAGCPLVIDSDGVWLQDDPSEPTGVHSASDAALARLWQGWFSRSDYVVLRAPLSFRIPWTAGLRRYFDANFTRIGSPNIAVYRHNERP